MSRPCSSLLKICSSFGIDGFAMELLHQGSPSARGSWVYSNELLLEAGTSFKRSLVLNGIPSEASSLLVARSRGLIKQAARQIAVLDASEWLGAAGKIPRREAGGVLDT